MRHWLSRCSTSTPRPVAAHGPRSRPAPGAPPRPSGDQPVRGDRVLDQPVDRGRVHRQRGPAEPAARGPAPACGAWRRRRPGRETGGGGADCDRARRGGAAPRRSGVSSSAIAAAPTGRGPTGGAGVAGGLGGAAPCMSARCMSSRRAMSAAEWRRWRPRAWSVGPMPYRRSQVRRVAGAMPSRRAAPETIRWGSSTCSTEAASAFIVRGHPAVLPRRVTVRSARGCMSRLGVPVRAVAGASAALRRGERGSRPPALPLRVWTRWPRACRRVGRGEPSYERIRKSCPDFLEQRLTRFYGGHLRDCRRGPGWTGRVSGMADIRRFPVPVTDIWDWQMDGACRGMDSGFFFHPEGERGPAGRRETRAKQICRTCPVLDNAAGTRWRCTSPTACGAGCRGRARGDIRGRTPPAGWPRAAAAAPAHRRRTDGPGRRRCG